MQTLDPDLVREVGIVNWVLMASVIAGVSFSGFLLHRLTKMMDRLTAAIEAANPVVIRVEAKLEAVDDKVTEAVALAREHVRIAKMWEQIEASERISRRAK